MAKIIRASVAQTCTAKYSLDDTLDKLERLTRLARDRDGSQICVFPEAFIGGYPKQSAFGAVVGERSPAGRDEFTRYHAAAIEVPSPAISRIEAVSSETGVFLVVGIIERDAGTLYCTAVFVDPTKGYVGKHRKLMPTGTERLIWGQGDETTLPVVEATFGTWVRAKISATICWENYMPLLRTFYYSQGTQLYCAPTVDARPEWQSTMQHIALEGRCFVLAACQYAQQKDYPDDHAISSDAMRDPEAVMIAGGSVIISPLGKILAGPLRDAEGVLTAELDLDDIVRGKFDLDVIGHYARNDIFQLKTNVPNVIV
ncbi:Bifunctional nitrilase/nitrile hydratase NIT4B [Hypsizygus marmoreus]|uniref:Bifunctional nitrilase/nitrile hydratase NIT4B n=1 Tax=Hypsizygus marmoreus TaxID=39966 RepID=A0A369JME0_HYPMA|nr:Bifunctional nitrilase/nitrile hydratase NIT4B [Hypsizygus marmoreus]